MASPYFSQINVQKPDFTPIVQGAQAYGEGIGQAFRALGKVGGLYFAEKNAEKRIADFMQTDIGKKSMEQAGIDITDGKEAMKQAKSLIKSAGGIKEFQQQMQSAIQAEQNEIKLRQQTRLYREQMKQIRANNIHNMIIASDVDNPDARSLDQSISGTRNEIDQLNNQLEDGTISEQDHRNTVYDLGKKLSKLNKDRSLIPNKVPILTLSPEQFSRAYGPAESPYQAALKAEAVQRLQDRQDMASDYQIKRMNAKNLDDQEKAAAMLPSFKPQNKVIIDEGIAMQEISQWSKENEVQLSTEQMSKLKELYTIVPPREIRAEKKALEEDNRLNEFDVIIESADIMNALLDRKGPDGKFVPVTDTASMEKLARIIQPDGVLTDKDIERVSGSTALVDRFRKAVSLAKDGTLDDDSREDLRIAGDVFKREAAKKKVKGVEAAINEISNSFVNPDDPYNSAFKKQITDRFFSEELNNIPEEFLPGNQNLSVSDAKVGQSTMVTINGNIESVRVVRILPSGQKIVEFKGQEMIIDPN